MCMNCHMAINKYEGEPIVTEDGKSINGNAEIEKLYAMQDGTQWLKPIKQIKIATVFLMGKTYTLGKNS